MKKYDEIIPIGMDCLLAICLNEIGIRTKSYPFDWLYKNEQDFFLTATNCILDDFAQFFKKENLEIKGKLKIHNTLNCKNTVTGFYHIHDFRANTNKLDKYQEAFTKYNRRISRLIENLSSDKDILFVCMEQYQTPDSVFVKQMNLLQNKYPSARINLLVLQHDASKKEVEYEEIKLSETITKILYNNDYEYSPKLNDKWYRNKKMTLKILKRYCNFKIPKISVIMPTYNAEQFLRESIESILEQTYSNFELLVIDDNSKDKTREIINSYDDIRIRIVDGDRKGLAAALNKGIREAKGEYIARMDADDISLPERFAKQVDYLKAHPEISLLGTQQLHFGSVVRFHKPPKNPEIAKLALVFGCDICHSTLMFRKDDFIKHDLFYPEGSSQEDFELWGKAIEFIKVRSLPEVLGEYRVHSNSITADKESKLIEYEARLVQKHLKKYFDIDLPDEDLCLITRRGKNYFKLNKKQKIDFQRRLEKLYDLIVKQNKKTKFLSPRALKKGLRYERTKTCKKENFVFSKYSHRGYLFDILEYIFTSQNTEDKKHKIIKILGIKIKIKR